MCGGLQEGRGLAAMRFPKKAMQASDIAAAAAVEDKAERRA
jgi:hypothetical protein